MKKYLCTVLALGGLLVASTPVSAQAPERRAQQHLRQCLGATVEQSQRGQAEGAVLRDIHRDGPADEAGLKNGDIITQADGKRVEGPAELVRILSRLRDGDKVALQVTRNGQEKTVNLAVREARMDDRDDSRRAGRQGDADDQDRQYQRVQRRLERLEDLLQEFARRDGSDFERGEFADRGHLDRLQRRIRQLESQLRDGDRQDQYGRSQNDNDDQNRDLARLVRRLAQRLEDQSRERGQNQYGRWQGDSERQSRRNNFLGVQTREWQSDGDGRQGADEGVVVTEVNPDSPAADAGLRRGDIITHVNSRAVGTPNELRQAIQRAGSGDRVSLVVMRGNRERVLRARLDEGSNGNAGEYGDQDRNIQRLQQQVQRLEERIRELERGR